MRKHSLFLLLLPFAAQFPIWPQQQTQRDPPGREGHALAYDAGLRRIVLFGGGGRTGLLNDTWFWGGKHWTQANPAVSPLTPEPPDRCTMVYYSARSQLLLFCDILSGSWLWKADTWMLITPPVRLAGGVAAYDAARKQIVVFGGAGATWIWDGSDWIQRSPAANPPVMAEAAIAYDSARSNVILFGEADGTTWLWDGVNWERRLPAHSPPKRSRHGMAYDQVHSEVVLFGGENGPGQYLSDTWVWDGTDWRPRFPARTPPARSRHAMAYDAERREVVLFGGETAQNGALPDDTWVWNGTTWSLRAAGNQEGK